MILGKDQAILLGLDERDMQVLKALNGASLSFTALAKATKLPRTSLYTTVGGLQHRGLVTEVKVGKRIQYICASEEVLHAKFSGIADSLSLVERVIGKKFILKGEMSSEYLVYKGLDNLVALYHRLGELDKHERIYGIQPNISAHSVMQKFPYDELVALNKQIKDKKIIVEALLQDNFLDFYKQKLIEEGKSSKDIFEAYGGRLAVTHYVPAQFLNFNSELMMTKDFAVIANWQEMVAVEIRDKEVVGMILQLFEFMKSISKKVDQNPMVEKIVKSLEDLGKK